MPILWCFINSKWRLLLESQLLEETLTQMPKRKIGFCIIACLPSACFESFNEKIAILPVQSG